ncbi:MAG: oxidoreductase [Gammaproteobacteria bacterium RIFCSPHIGHO2_12_FULL_42_10]|nr:MAG: oxidoreductase [Gammaproteobacteria bacterium RIFCSPHIGHO2_12_FULL_42_10]
MRIIVVGLGVQGHKRRQFAGTDYVLSVDPVNVNADYHSIQDVPLKNFDAALLCVPDEPKIELIHYLLSNGKHVLVEKPLWAAEDKSIESLQSLARAKNLILYTAYNHRFEPHFIRMHDLLASHALGEIYRCRMFYGNGTARLVRDSDWRDQGAGVLPDLGSHLLDIVHFWFGIQSEFFSIVSSHCFENRSPDHVVFHNQDTNPKLEMEMTLLSWRNHFTCDIFAEKGSAHISSLCKWGPSQFTYRMRELPSGIPKEDVVTLAQPDPTWALEYAHFKSLCVNGVKTDLSVDIWLNSVLRKLSEEMIGEKKLCINLQ